MGTQFWWFFDVFTAALLLVAVFIAGKKGFGKTLVFTIGCAASVLLAIALSGPIANFAYGSAIEHGNLKNLKEELSSSDLSADTKTFMEGMGYNIRVNDSRVSEIFLEGGDVVGSLYEYANNINGKVVDSEENFRKKMNEGLAGVVRSVFTDSHSAFAGEAVYDEVLADMSKLPQILTLIEEQANEPEVHDYTEASKLLEAEYCADVYKDMISLAAFAVISLIVLILVMNISGKMNGDGGIGAVGDIADHIIGGVFGVLQAAVFMLVIAAAVRLVVTLGGSDMILFNEESINKTYVFKHIYNFTEML